jgi:hypothetical protein
VKPIVALAALGGLCATLTACGGSAPPPPASVTPKPVAAVPPAPAAAPKPATSPVPAAPAAPAPTSAPAAGAAQPAPLVPVPAIPRATGPTYEDKGRRDPFQPLDVAGGARGLQVSATKLTGIVRSAKTTLALVETQDGIGYILKPGDMLGDGRVTEIGADSVVFTVPDSSGSPSNRVVLKLAAN